MTAQAQYAAWLIALDAACTKPVYGYDTVPGTNQNPGIKPADYLLLTVERMFIPANRMTAQNAVTGYRGTLRAVGPNATNVRVSLEQARGAVDEKRLTVDGKSTSPIQHESSQPAEWDDGAYSALDTYTFTH